MGFTGGQRKGLFNQNFGKENSIMEAGSVGLISKGEPKIQIMEPKMESGVMQGFIGIVECRTFLISKGFRRILCYNHERIT